jgi:hypothetical protein
MNAQQHTLECWRPPWRSSGQSGLLKGLFLGNSGITSSLQRSPDVRVFETAVCTWGWWLFARRWARRMALPIRRSLIKRPFFVVHECRASQPPLDRETHCTTCRVNSKNGTFYGCATASQASCRTQLQVRHLYMLTAANRAVMGKSPKCCILWRQTSHFRSVS